MEGKRKRRQDIYYGDKKTKTVKEVIEEVNLKFRTLITDEGVEVVGSYLETVTQDEDIKEIIRSNKMTDPEMVYQTIIRDKMQASLQDFIMAGIGKGIYSSGLYEKITSDNVMPFINKTAYNLIRENLKAA